MPATNAASHPKNVSLWRRAITLRRIEWIPILVAVVLNVICGAWLAYATLQTANAPGIPSPDSYAAALHAPSVTWKIVQPIWTVLVLFGLGCWLRRVVALVRE